MRRRSLIAGAGVAATAVAAGLYRFTDLFVKHYPPTPYDDVLEKVVDRNYAARLGAVVKDAPDAATLAARLRKAMPGTPEAAALADVAAGRLVEVDGWLLPQTVVWMAALAAKT